MSELEAVHNRLVPGRSQRARKSSTQQATVALQSSVGNQAVGRMLQRSAVPSAQSTIARTPTAAEQQVAEADKWDGFFRAGKGVIGGQRSESYAEYQTKLVPVTSFRGGGKRGHPVLVAKLEEVSAKLTDEDRKAVGISSVFRDKASYHGLGLAVDFDVDKNPYMIGEHGDDKQAEAKWVEVYDRIALFFLGRKSVLPQLNNMKSDFAKKDVGEKYYLLHEESEAMKKYFRRTITIFEPPEDQGKNQKQQGKKWQERVHNDAPAIAEMLTICGNDIDAVCDRLGIAGGSSEFESQLKVEKQIDKDYSTIGGKDDLGNWLKPAQRRQSFRSE